MRRVAYSVQTFRTKQERGTSQLDQRDEERMNRVRARLIGVPVGAFPGLGSTKEKKESGRPSSDSRSRDEAKGGKEKN